MTASPSLKSRTTSGAVWAALQIGVSYSLRLASNLILARLLAPETFGQIGLTIAVVTALHLLSDIGISQSIVREADGDTPSFLHAAWRAKILRGLVITAVGLLCAALLWILGPALVPPDSAYAQPMLPGLIAAVSVLGLLTCVESTNVSVAGRRMDMRRIVLVQLAVQVVTMIATVLAATMIASAWAIVFGMLCGNATSLLLSYAIFPGPRMAWNGDPVLAGRLWRFGRWIMMSSSLTFVQTTADKFILAALLSPVAFGHYVIALIWVEAGGQVASALRSRIFFPAFSEIGLSRPHDLPRIYRRLKRIEDLYLFAAFAALSLGAPLLIDLLYPDDYAEAARFLSLAATALLVARFNTITELLLSLGETRAVATAAAIRTVSLLFALPLGWLIGGVDGLIIANALHPLAQLPFLFLTLKRRLPQLSLTEDYLSLPIIAAILGLVLIPMPMP